MPLCAPGGARSNPARQVSRRAIRSREALVGRTRLRTRASGHPTKSGRPCPSPGRWSAARPGSRASAAAGRRRTRRGCVRRAGRRCGRCRPRPSRPARPAGICTIESSESMPSRCLSGTGTPITGSGVTAASMPGRWAAPPAPAMITAQPALGGRRGRRPASPRASGAPRRRRPRRRRRTPRAPRPAAFITGQSESEPITMPTRRCLSSCVTRSRLPRSPREPRRRVPGALADSPPGRRRRR